MHRFTLKQHENMLFWPTSLDRLSRVHPGAEINMTLRNMTCRSGILS